MRQTGTKLQRAKRKLAPGSLVYLPAVGWSKEEQLKGSGYFSPGAVPSSNSGIRCGSITLSWTPTEMALFSHLVLLHQRQGNRRHSGSSRRKVIPRWHLVPRATMSATKSQFHSVKDYWMRHPPRSYLGNKANLCRPIRVGLILPLGYCIRSPTSTLIICTQTKVKWWRTLSR